MGAEPDALVGGIDREEIVPERLAAAFMAHATTIRTRKGQLLIAEGSTADDVYLIVGGRLQISMIAANRSEEHTSELQSPMRISYAVFCLKKTKHTTQLA